MCYSPLLVSLPSFHTIMEEVLDRVEIASEFLNLVEYFNIPKLSFLLLLIYVIFYPHGFHGLGD